jgi:pimeloyl-ACP methyl ester carboxylesterase
MPDETPIVRYARSGDLTIAYQVLGDGPSDLVWVPGLIGHLELEWEEPRMARLFRRLAAFSRFIRFDKRGAGLSERVIGAPTLEERMEDVRIVMDAVGSERAALLGVSEGGPMSIMFAATYPERTLALILYGTFAKWLAEAGYAGFDSIEPLMDALTTKWGTGASLEFFARKWASNERARAQMARVERGAASPRSVRAMLEVIGATDVRTILPTISVPTLVVARTDDFLEVHGFGRYLAAHIPGAQYFEQPGEHLPNSGDVDALADRIEAFLTGGRAEAVVDRVLATVNALAQFAGGLAGVVLADVLLRGALAHPAVRWVVTMGMLIGGSSCVLAGWLTYRPIPDVFRLCAACAVFSTRRQTGGAGRLRAGCGWFARPRGGVKTQRGRFVVARRWGTPGGRGRQAMKSNPG